MSHVYYILIDKLNSLYEAMPDLVLKSLYHWFHEISCCRSQVFRSIEEKLLVYHLLIEIFLLNLLEIFLGGPKSVLSSMCFPLAFYSFHS